MLPNPALDPELHYRCIDCGHPNSYQDHIDCPCCNEHPHCQGCGQPESKCWCCGCHDEYPCPGDESDYDPFADESIGDEDDEDEDEGTYAYQPTPLSEAAEKIKTTLGAAKVKPAKAPGFKPHGQTNPLIRWEKRGIKITTDSPYQDWQQAWPLVQMYHKVLDPCQAAADFYILDALRHRVLNDARAGLPYHGLDDVAAEADLTFRFCLEVLDALFQEYVEMACGGELRHHPACKSTKMPSVRRQAWAYWKHIREVVGVDALMDMTEMFGDFGGGGYGGPKWAAASRLLYQRQTRQVNALQFVDQVFQLVHNGGVFLNKMQWAVLNKQGWDLNQLQGRILPAQAKDGWYTLLLASSTDVSRLWTAYWRASNRSRVMAGLRPALDPRWTQGHRWMCRSCSSNPAHGHTFSCMAFISGELRQGTAAKKYFIRVPEADWGSYRWHTWEWPPEKYPVGPDGYARMLAGVTYSLKVIVWSRYGIAERTLRMFGGRLMDYFVRLDMFKDQLPHFEDAGPFSWKLELRDNDGQVVLDELVGPALDDETTLFDMVIPCRIVLPMRMTKVDWSTLWEEVH